MALISPIDIIVGWDSKLLDGAMAWGTALNYLRGSGGGHDLVTAEMLCCSPLLGTGGKATFNTLVAGDSFLQKHGRKVYDAILTHVTRVWSLLDEMYINNPEMFAIGTSNLYDVGKASMRDMSPPTDPTAAKGTYNYKDEVTTHFNLFSYAKYNRQQQLSCTYLADQQTQTCIPASGGFAKATVDTAQFMAANGNLAYYKNASMTQTYIDSSYVREAPALLPGVTLASLRARGPGPETVMPTPAATKCISRQELVAGAATFGDGHAPGGAYLDGMECGWAIPGPSVGKVLTLSFSLFSCEVENDYLDIYAGSNATAPLLGHYTGGSVKGDATPSISSTTGMFVIWKTDNIMSRAWINPSEDGFTASYNTETNGCSADAQCGGGTGKVAGICDTSTGLCVCSPGYGGSDCSYDSCFGTTTLRDEGILMSHAPERTASRNNARCVWELDSGNTGKVASLRFDKFDLENGFDKLRVYSYMRETEETHRHEHGNSGTAKVKTLLREFTGSAYAAGLVVKSPGGRLTVEFSSDAIHMSKGFEIIFESKAGDKHCEVDADCSGSSSGTCRQKTNICQCNPGYSGFQCECGPGLCINALREYVPTVYSIKPRVISPKGGLISIVGSDFRQGVIAVLIGDKVCTTPTYKSDTLIECHVNPGVGGPHEVVVKCGGVPSTTKIHLSYALPHIYHMDKFWVAHGSLLRVTGAFFVDGSTKCRIKGLPATLATVIDDSHSECEIRLFSATAGDGTTLEIAKLGKLEMSNDDGQRWVSGVTVDSPIEWAGGGLNPVSPTTINYPKEVVIGGLVPTDMFLDPKKAKQYVRDITFAYNMAASTINGAGLFPGGIHLRVEILPVDLGAAVNVASAFANKGIAANATTTAARTTNVVGLVGLYWSENALSTARDVSNPYNLPTISYDAWTSELDNATDFPYFLRVGPANSDRAKVLGIFMRSLGWLRIAVVTDENAGMLDFGLNVVSDMKGNGGTVLYHGVFPTISSHAVVDQQGQLHSEGATNISSHMFRARAKGARIIFVMARGDAGKVALYTSLEAAGFFDEGFAVVDGLPIDMSHDLVVGGNLTVNGLVYLSAAAAHKCKALQCPHVDDAAAPSRELNQAHDAVLVLATALAPLFRDGGESYLAGVPPKRFAAMAAIRATSLSSDTAASGALAFTGGRVTTREKWNFGYQVMNVQGSPPQSVVVGRVEKGGFESPKGAAKAVWPGGTTKFPQHLVRRDPKNLSVGWVVETAWLTPVLKQEARMYFQQAIDEINDSPYLLPNTYLTLEMDDRVNANDKTVEAYNFIEARARAAGRPLAMVLAASSSHMATIYNPQNNVTVTRRSTGVPIIGYGTGAGVLSDSKRFPNFVRLYPPVSETQHAYRKVAFELGWNRVGCIADKADSFSTSFFDVINGTDASNPNNLQPPLDAQRGPYDAERLVIAHAASIDFIKDTNATKDAFVDAIKAKDVKVIILFGTTVFVNGILLYGLDRGIFGPGYQILVSEGAVHPNDMDPRSRAALDGAVLVEAAATVPTYPGLQRSSAFWRTHSPTESPVGADTTTPFRIGGVSGRKTRFSEASLYDSVMLAAVGIEACLVDGCRPVGHGYEEVMPYIRAATIDGVAGLTSIKKGSNDPQVRLTYQLPLVLSYVEVL